MYALMTLLLMLVILFVAYGDQISVVALPLTTRTSSSAARLVLIPSRNEKLIFFLLFDLPCHSIYTGYASVLAFSTSIANTSQSVLVRHGEASGLIRGPRSGSLPEKSEQQQQQPADSAPYTTFTRIPGPTNDVNGTVDESTIASSGMNGAVTQDVITTSTEKITRATSSTLVVATTPAPSSLDVFWPIWSDITTELASTVAITTTFLGHNTAHTLVSDTCDQDRDPDDDDDGTNGGGMSLRESSNTRIPSPQG
ncbi:hypothetical protein BJV77DRAFT_1068043 [Russula vinacea]|nr:hypothetical protein BJV77DRAFT_1068043 [Russula vinacea]